MVDMYTNIENGKYKNNENYPSEQWRARDRQISSEFYDDLCRYHGLNPDGKKASLIYNYAYQNGHGSGFHDVVSCFEDIVDLIREIES